MLKKLIAILSIAAVHLALSRIIVAVTMTIDLLDPDTGRATALFGKTMIVVTRILYFPILTLSLYSRQWFPGNLIYIPIFFNSLVWGLVLYLAFHLWRKYTAR
jgi:hypothetical protein